MRRFVVLYKSLEYTQVIIERGEFMDYHSIITLEPGKRGGKPCIRGLRITVYDVLSWLASGMTTDEILTDFPELTAGDIVACLSFAADREHKLTSICVA